MSRPESSRLEFIESLRLLAALLVFLQHLIEHYRMLPGLDALTRLGPGLAGVVIFFVVSGYVVPMSVQRGFDPLTFMVRRIFRVFPLLLFIFAMLLLAGASGALSHWAFMRAATPMEWAANLLLLQDFTGVRPFLGVTWTLAIEFVWYVLFAMSLWRFGDRAGTYLNIALPVILAALAISSLVLGVRIPLGRIAMIYACVLGYQAYLYDTGKVSLNYLLCSIVIFLAVTFSANIVGFGVFSHPNITMMQAIWPWAIAPVAFFGVILFKPIRNSALLNSGLLPRFGAASYSIYMVHTISISAAEQYVDGHVLQIAASIGLTSVLSFIGYRFVELSGVQAGKRFVSMLHRNGWELNPRPAS